MDNRLRVMVADGNGVVDLKLRDVEELLRKLDRHWEDKNDRRAMKTYGILVDLSQVTASDDMADIMIIRVVPWAKRKDCVVTWFSKSEALSDSFDAFSENLNVETDTDGIMQELERTIGKLDPTALCVAER